MSGSPKYSYVRLSGWELTRLEAERAAARERERVATEARARAEQARLEAARRQREEDERKRQAELKAEAERKAAEALARRRAEVEAQLEPLLAKVAALRGDQVTMTWCEAEVEAQVSALEVAGKQLGQDFFDQVSAACVSSVSAIQALEQRAQERQLVEEKRGHIVNGMMAVLQQQGFQVGTPALSRPGDFESDVVLRAVRPDNRSINISVPTAGNVIYEIDGWTKRQEPGRDGHAVATCDDAEARLRAIGDQLETEFGIEVGEIMWDGKDPDRVQKGAKSFPGSGPAVNRTHGGGG